MKASSHPKRLHSVGFFAYILLAVYFSRVSFFKQMLLKGLALQCLPEALLSAAVFSNRPRSRSALPIQASQVVYYNVMENE